MKVYKDAHMKIFSPYIISKHILKKKKKKKNTVLEASLIFQYLIKKLLNVLWHAKNTVQLR